MGDENAKLIEAWFADHDEDGEFAYHPRTPYLVYGPTSEVGRIVIATKFHPVSLAIAECAECAGFGMIGRYGLPSDADMRWIAEIVAKHELVFLGDMDPVDLMIFAWLRARLRPKHVGFLGVSDAYLSYLQVSLPESFIMTCAPSEQRSLTLLDKVFPDFRETVGPGCSLILEQGRKIELEAVVSALGTAVPILLAATKGSNGTSDPSP